MKIELEHKEVEAAIEAATTKAIAEALSGWELRQQMVAAVGAAVAKVNLAVLIEVAVSDALDREAEALVKVAVAEALPAVRAAIAASMREMTIGMVAGCLRGVPHGYVSDNERAAITKAKRLIEGQARPEPEPEPEPMTEVEF